MMEYTFKDHLYIILTRCKNVNTMKHVSEEWDWWVKEYDIKLNSQTWQEYTDAMLFCSSLIEDYEK